MDVENKIILGFTGDVSFTGIFHSKVTKRQDVFDDKTKQILKDNDANVINFEGAIKKTESIKKGKAISNPYQSINYLKQNNIDFSTCRIIILWIMEYRDLKTLFKI